MRYTVMYLDDVSRILRDGGVSYSLLMTLRHMLRLKREGAYELILRIEI